MKVHKSFTWHGWLTARSRSQFQNPKSDPIQPISSKGFPPSDGWLKWIPTLTQSSPEPVSNWTSVALGLLGSWKTCYLSYPINRHGKSQCITYWFPRFFWHPILTSLTFASLKLQMKWTELDLTFELRCSELQDISKNYLKNQPAEWHILYIIHLQRVPKNTNLFLHRIPFLSVDNPLWNP